MDSPSSPPMGLVYMLEHKEKSQELWIVGETGRKLETRTDEHFLDAEKELAFRKTWGEEISNSQWINELVLDLEDCIEKHGKEKSRAEFRKNWRSSTLEEVRFNDKDGWTPKNQLQQRETYWIEEMRKKKGALGLNTNQHSPLVRRKEPKISLNLKGFPIKGDSVNEICNALGLNSGTVKRHIGKEEGDLQRGFIRAIEEKRDSRHQIQRVVIIEGKEIVFPHLNELIEALTYGKLRHLNTYEISKSSLEWRVRRAEERELTEEYSSGQWPWERKFMIIPLDELVKQPRKNTGKKYTVRVPVSSKHFVIIGPHRMVKLHSVISKIGSAITYHGGPIPKLPSISNRNDAGWTMEQAFEFRLPPRWERFEDEIRNGTIELFPPLSEGGILDARKGPKFRIYYAKKYGKMFRTKGDFEAFIRKFRTEYVTSDIDIRNYREILEEKEHYWDCSALFEHYGVPASLR